VKLEMDVVELPNCAAVTVVVKAQIAVPSNNDIATGTTSGFNDFLEGGEAYGCKLAAERVSKLALNA
jgi:hypothetical protein